MIIDFCLVENVLPQLCGLRFEVSQVGHAVFIVTLSREVLMVRKC